MPLFFPELRNDFQRLINSVSGKKIAVAGHMRPDGDCISSQFALADILAGCGAKEVVCLNQNPLHYLYENFAYGSKLLNASEFADTSFEIVTVDCADYKRTNLELCARFPAPLGCIDHHATNDTYAQINIIDTHAAATAELIAGMAFDEGIHVSAENANRLYMGIVMDTRQFTTSSVRTQTFEIATELVKRGADAAWVAVELYQRERFEKMKLLALYLQSMTMHLDGRVCIGVLPADAYTSTGAEKADSDGLVDYARAVNGVEIAVLLEALPNGVKGSLRGKGPQYMVNDLAAKFGGGGHLAAAGFTAEGYDLNTLYPKMLSLIEEHFQNLDKLNSKI